MPFVLIVIAAILIVTGVKGTYKEFGTLLASEFSSDSNFIYWIVSIMIIGAIGYIPKFKPVSDYFIVLLLIVLFLAQGNPNTNGGGFFGKFNDAIRNGMAKL
jgi:type III secretory pathway component EscV